MRSSAGAHFFPSALSLPFSLPACLSVSLYTAMISFRKPFSFFLFYTAVLLYRHTLLPSHLTLYFYLPTYLPTPASPSP
ncbi:hypothetical protein F5X96DRAFT_650557 [Biscogniauxia mediterranea]|nr:hypothetical protein F5X96DRAFT_650557 [Biscogniauxia mediterranea]